MSYEEELTEVLENTENLEEQGLSEAIQVVTETTSTGLTDLYGIVVLEQIMSEVLG